MRRPRVDLISPPFSGHLHPLLGIGRRLSDDVDVRVVSTESAAARTRASGLEPYTLMAGRDDAIRAITEPEVPVRGHPLKLHAQFRATLAILGGFRDELRALYRRDPPDLVIVDSVLPVAGYVALEFGIPWWTSLPSPCVLEAPDGPPAYLGGLAPRHDRFGRARDAIGRTLVRTFKRVAVRMNRRALDALGLPSAYRADGSEAAYSPECILALALAELEFPRQWPAAVRFMGPVRYTPPATVEAPEFRPGRRHVLVSIGTHLRHEKDRVAAAAMTAARAQPDTEFHFTDGRPDAPSPGREGNFHRLPYVHYSLVAGYDLVVHHAGSGVMYETIAAGVPAIVVPLDFDQFDNAVRLRHAGLAIGLRSLEEMPHAIERAFAGATSREARHRFRDLVINHPGEEGVAALVRDRLETNSSTVAAFAR